MELKFLLFILAFYLMVTQSESISNSIFGMQKTGSLLLPPKRDILQKDLQPYYFDQKLDHFNPSNKTTWKQLYFFNDELYNKNQENRVAFLMLGGEGPASPFFLQVGPMYDYAQESGAIMFELEHRYYGKSRPTEDLRVKNLQFLSSEQALADAAAFIEFANEEYGLGNNTRWIAFGGSYSGSLAAWLRMKYPHLVHGAVSSCSPLLAKVDFKEYFRIVSESLGTYSAECVSTIKSAFYTLKLAISDGDSATLQNIDSALHLCEPLEDYLDDSLSLSNLQLNMSVMVGEVVQYNNIVEGRPNIETICDIMTDESLGDPLVRLGVVLNMTLPEDENCISYNYTESVEEMKNANYDSKQAETKKQWFYQVCTELGFFQTSSYKTHVFGDMFNTDFYIQSCIDIYGKQFDGDFIDFSINHTNMMYGGLNIDVSNVVYVYGSIDPWHALGIVETKDERSPSIYINGTAHCANMYTPKDSDPQELWDAVNEVGSLIREWLAQ